MPIAPTSFVYELDAETSVATIRLDRPERLNALTFTVYHELIDTFRALDEEPTVRAVVLTGTGRAFCSGGDVEEIIGPLLEQGADDLLAFTRMTCDLIHVMRACRRPIVAALNGTTAGAGAVIATACDLRIATPTAKIAFLFPRVGLSGADMGASWLLPRMVGFGRASHLLLTGDSIEADEAWRIGLYNRVVPAADLAEEAATCAARLAAGPAEALAETKRALDVESTMSLSDALAYESEVQARLMLGRDFREAYTAFRERRAPKFD